MKPKIMAEACCNHMGEFKIALDMINIASDFCKADYIKFQKRNIKENLSKERYFGMHPNPENSFGSTYGEHREYLEFDIDTHDKLKFHCEKKNIGYAVSVFDLTSATECINLNPEIIKIPSALNGNKDLLNYVFKNQKKQIHISTGMTTNEELTILLNFIRETGRGKDVVIYSCTSSYPCKFEDLHLLNISKLIKDYSHLINSIGFSGHHNGICADIAALALGAIWYERHFTLDRTWKGTDQAASLEPDGLRRLVRDLNNVSKSLTFRPDGILECESFNKHFHKDNKGLN